MPTALMAFERSSCSLPAGTASTLIRLTTRATLRTLTWSLTVTAQIRTLFVCLVFSTRRFGTWAPILIVPACSPSPTVTLLVSLSDLYNPLEILRIDISIGFGYHGDFIMGWDETTFTLQEAVDTCTNLSGEIEDCPLFTVISEAEQNECHMDTPAALVKEDTAGPMTVLPGDVAIAWGPEPAGAASSGSGTTTTVTMPTLSYSAGSTATNNASVVPGNIFQITPTTTTTTPYQAAVTEAPTLTSAADGSMITVGTSTYTYTGADGDVTISEIVIEEAVTWVTELTTTTVTMSTPTGVARRRENHFHGHQHRRAVHKH